MRNFSVVPDSSTTALEQYTDYLKAEVYNNPWHSDETSKFNNSTFLKQLSIVQAESIRKAIQANGETAFDIGMHTSKTIALASQQMSQLIVQRSSEIASSFENGYSLLNASLCNIDSTLERISGKIDVANQNIRSIADIARMGFLTVSNQLTSINQGITLLNNNVGMIYSALRTASLEINSYLKSILSELKIPESQRERRYHTEEGLRFLSKAMKSGKSLYFDDALDEFSQSMAIEKKDYFVWYNLALIYSYSCNHLDLDKAIEAYDYCLHYALALPDNDNIRNFVNDVYFNQAELLYVKGDASGAAKRLESCSGKMAMALFYRAKYLSSTKEDSQMSRAAELIYDLLCQNPFMAMRILEDYDLLQNDYVAATITKVKSELSKKVTAMFNQYFRYYSMVPKPDDEVKQRTERIEELIEKGTIIDFAEALSILTMNVEIDKYYHLEIQLKDYPICGMELCSLRDRTFQSYRCESVGFANMFIYNSLHLENFCDRICAICRISFDLEKGDLPIVLDCLSFIALELKIYKESGEEFHNLDKLPWYGKFKSFVGAIIEQLKFLEKNDISSIFRQIDDVYNQLNDKETYRKDVALLLHLYVKKEIDREKKILEKRREEMNWLQKMLFKSKEIEPKEIHNILLEYALAYGGADMEKEYRPGR